MDPPRGEDTQRLPVSPSGSSAVVAKMCVRGARHRVWPSLLSLYATAYLTSLPYEGGYHPLSRSVHASKVSWGAPWTWASCRGALPQSRCLNTHARTQRAPIFYPLHADPNRSS